MANPLTAAWDYLRGADLQTLPPPAPQEPPTEVKSFVFTTDSYEGGLADALYPTLSQALGGSSVTWNSAVFSCLKVLAQSFQEAPLRVFRAQSDGTENWLDEHPLMALLDDPHPSLSQPELNFWLVWCLNTNGNAYLRKIRNRARGVVQLWPVSSLNLHPETTDPDRQAGVFISHYVYDDGKGTRENVPVEDIIHFRLGVDDQDHRYGLSPLKRLLKEISSDEEATRFTDALLKNFGVTSLAVSVPPGPVLTEEQAQQIRDRLRTDYGGANRGHVAVVANGATLQSVGFNPQQLDLKTAHQQPESRIASVLGVPAMLVGFSIGLEHTIYSNMEQAQEHLFEQTVIPLWRSVAATYQKQLLRPDYTADTAIRLKYDLSDVRALQEDEDQLWARISVAVEKGWLTKDEGRDMIGLEPLPDGLGEAKDPAELLALAAPPGANGRPGAQNGAATKALEHKAAGMNAIPGMQDVLAALTTPLVQADLEAYFREQADRVTQAVVREG